MRENADIILKAVDVTCTSSRKRIGRKPMKRVISICILAIMMINLVITKDGFSESNPANPDTTTLDLTSGQDTQPKDWTGKLEVTMTQLSDGKELNDGDSVDITKSYTINADIKVPVKSDFTGQDVPGKRPYVKKNDRVTIPLCENIALPTTYDRIINGKKIVVDDAEVLLQAGSLEVVEENYTKTDGTDAVRLVAHILFDGDDRIFDGTVHDVRIKIAISFTIKEEAVEVIDGKKYITLLDKREVKTPEYEVILEKNGVLDEENKKIIWTITAALENKDKSFRDLAGYILEEDFSQLITKQSALKWIDGQTETKLSWTTEDVASGKFRYVFPAGSVGKYQFKIVSDLTDKQFYLKDHVGHTNSVKLFRDQDQLNGGKPEKEVVASVTIFGHPWIEKASRQQGIEAGKHYADWMITINREKKKLKNVQILDEMAEGMTFVHAYWEKEDHYGYFSQHGAAFTAKPANDIYALGDIDTTYRLIIRTYFDLEGKKSKLFTNIAKVQWGENVGTAERVEFSNGHILLVGDAEAFVKKKGKDIYTDANLKWNITVKRDFLQTLDNPKVYDLLVYDNSIKLEHIRDKNQITGLPAGVEADDLISSGFSHLKYVGIEDKGGIGLQTEVSPISYRGVPIGDLVAVSGDRNADWNYTLTTLPMDSSIIKNGEMRYHNSAALYSVNGSQHKFELISTDSLIFQSIFSEKKMLKSAVIPKLKEAETADLTNLVNDVTDPYNAWSQQGLTDEDKKQEIETAKDNNRLNGYNHKEKKIAYRIGINRNGHNAALEAMGGFTVYDILPGGWVPADVTDKRFLVFRGKTTYKDIVTSTATFEFLDTFEAVGEPLTDEQIREAGIEIIDGTRSFTFRFQKELEYPYVVVLAITPIDWQYDLYLKGGEQGTESFEIANNLRTTATKASSIPGIPDGSEVSRDIYQNTIFEIKPLEKVSKSRGDGLIDWLVTFDAFLMLGNQNNIKIKDTIGAGHEYVLETIPGTKIPTFITLLQYDDGTDVGEQTIELEFDRNIHYDRDARSLIVDIPNQTKRYKLKYQTEVVAKSIGQNLENAVSVVSENRELKKVLRRYTTVSADVEATFKKTGAIEIVKVAEGAESLRLKDAKFTLAKQGRDVTLEGITDKNGYLRFSGLKAGEYVLQETEAPNGYRLQNKQYRIVITDITGIVVGINITVDGQPYAPIRVVNEKEYIPPKTPITPYVPESEPKPEPPKESIPMIPLVPATPIKPPTPIVPYVPSVPSRPRNPNQPYNPYEFGENQTPHGDPNYLPLSPDGQPLLIVENPFPSGNRELPKTSGIPVGDFIWTGALLVVGGYRLCSGKKRK